MLYPKLPTSQSAARLASSTYFPALTGVRAVAAALVFFFHFNPFRAADSATPVLNELRLFIQQWNAGVTLFFVLSGFLITTRYQYSIAPSWEWARRYLQNRFARIYPLYLLLTLLTIAFSQWGGHDYASLVWREYNRLDKVVFVVLNLTLARAYFHSLLFSGVTTAWSLTVEETFYVTAPFILWSLQRHPWRRLLGYALGLPALGLGIVALCQGRLPYQFMDSPFFCINYTYFGHGAEFMAGIGLALWYARAPLRATQSVSLTTWGGIGFLIILFVNAHVQQSPASAWLANLAIALAVCVLFYGLLTERTLLRRALASKPMDLLGKSSYAFYLLHVGFFHLFLYQIGLMTAWTMLLPTTLASIALYKFVEHPLHLRLKSKPQQHPEKVLA